MNHKKSVLVGAMAGVVGVTMAHFLAGETNLPNLVSRLMGGALGIFFYFGVVMFFRSKQSK